MKEKKSKKEILVTISLVSVVLLMITLAIKVPNKVVSEGKAISSREWVLSKGTDGRLMTPLICKTSAPYGQKRG